ncbi:MAG: WecB/TagA/CpsF family glycosyltransferase [Succinivibrio sp.]
MFNRNFQVGKIGFNLCTQKQAAHLIYTMNVEQSSQYVIFWGGPMAVSAYNNPLFQTIEKQACYCFADGSPIVMSAKLRGIKDIERCSGPDVMHLVLTESVKKGKTHFFYGSTEENLRNIKTSLIKKYKNIKIAGMYSPPFRDLTEEEDIAIVDMLNKAQPDYLWVALGEPKQEKWCFEHYKRIKSAKILAVGAAFDFYSGNLKRAPKIMQRFCLEWLFRLVSEPKRLWKRYIISIPRLIFLMIFKSKQL